MITIDENQTLWRYMSLKRFNDLIEQSALFFCRADKFSDPFEGTIPRREFEHRQHNNLKSAELSEDPERIRIGQSNEKGISTLHRTFQMGMTVNCWHINNSESNTMWQSYVKNNEGVVVQSTPLRMKKAFNGTENKILRTKVRYIDYGSGIWNHPIEYPHYGYNMLTPIVHKRIEFKEEQEYRLIRQIPEVTDRRNVEYWNNQPNSIGELIIVDLKALIEKVILHPTTGNKTLPKIQKILSQANLTIPIEKSSLNSPLYF